MWYMHFVQAARSVGYIKNFFFFFFLRKYALIMCLFSLVGLVEISAHYYD